jgi:hypothetical protein
VWVLKGQERGFGMFCEPVDIRTVKKHMGCERILFENSEMEENYK